MSARSVIRPPRGVQTRAGRAPELVQEYCVCCRLATIVAALVVTELGALCPECLALLKVPVIRQPDGWPADRP